MSVTTVRLGGRPGLPLLVLGPSLGTPAAELWAPAAEHLGEHFEVIGWDLPGHGHNRLPLGDDPVTMASLAADVLAVVDELPRDYPARFHYAGDSVGGAVGLQLMLDAPDRVLSATLLCTGARIGTEESWGQRMAALSSGGTEGLVEASAQRWFEPGFAAREPERASTLLRTLGQVSDDGYAAVVGVLAGFDVRDRLGSITTPVLAVAGAYDAVTPPSLLADLARGVQDGRLEVLADAAHLAPAESPARVAALISEHALGATAEPGADRRAAGNVVRREVLGKEHVDRATAGATELTQDFQDFITEYAWGGIWTRPGLDRRSRSVAVLTALVARGHHDELAMHLVAARRNGLTVEEIKEVLLQAAIYCGVPDANTAFKIAQRTLGDLGDA